ncbi:membrane bound O-acyl transferase family-domain-containing protein [Cyathus striatus]|nr:membrane bound O-acyl transferase family-domain-containing protein [Cyathus striatus]
MKNNAYGDVRLVRLQPICIFTIYLLLFLGLVSRSRAVRAILFIPILIISTYIWVYTTSGIVNDSLIWPFIAQIVLMASDAFLINDVSKLRRVEQTEDTNHLGVWDRSKWALDFMFNYRLIGWTHEPRHVLPPHPTESKWQFVRSGIVKCIMYYALCDIAQTLIWYTPLHKWRETSIMAIGFRVMHTAMYAFTGSLGPNIVYTAASIIAVTISLTDPSEWPPVLGRWSDAYTVRRFWGRTWHQCLRRIFSSHGDFVAYRLLRLEKGTSLGTNVQRYAAFGLSGLLHAIGDYGMFRSRFSELSGSMTFFLLQATAIMLEQEIGKLLGVKAGKWTRRMGYVWTFCWFVLTFPPWTDPQLRVDPSHWSPRCWRRGSITNYLLTGKWNFEVR